MNPEKITAWALEELSPEEQAQISAALLTQPQDQQQAADTRDFCGFLTQHLQDESLALTPEQRQRLTQISTTPQSRPTPSLVSAPAPWWRRHALANLAAAAAVLILATLLVRPETRPGSQTVTQNFAISQPPADKSPTIAPTKRQEDLRQLALQPQPPTQPSVALGDSPVPRDSNQLPSVGSPALAKPLTLTPSNRRLANLTPTTPVEDLFFSSDFQQVSDGPVRTLPLQLSSASWADARAAGPQDNFTLAEKRRIKELVSASLKAKPLPALAQAQPISFQADLLPCPWQPKHQLARVQLHTRPAAPGSAKPTLLAREATFQMEFNPRQVRSYRVLTFTPTESPIPLETSAVLHEGQSFVALFEIIPTQLSAAPTDPLQLASPPPLKTPAAPTKQPSFSAQLRYKEPEGGRLRKMEVSGQ